MQRSMGAPEQDGGQLACIHAVALLRHLLALLANLHRFDGRLSVVEQGLRDHDEVQIPLAPVLPLFRSHPCCRAPARWWAPPLAWCPAGIAPSASWRPLPGGAAATACGTRDQAPPGEGRGGATEGRLTAKKGIESSAERSNSEQVNRRHLLPFCAADHRQCSCPSAPCRLRPRRLRASCAPPRSRTSATPFPPRLQAGPGCAHIESA